MKKNLLIFNIILVLVIAIANNLANAFFLYWRFYWFDNVMHFLGGLWVGLMALWIYYFSGYIKSNRYDKPFLFLMSFIAVLSVGIGWEIFEVLIDVNFSSGYVSDTALDLIMDIVGGLASATTFVMLKLERQKNLLK